METVDVKLPSELLKAANLEESRLSEEAARLLALELYREDTFGVESSVPIKGSEFACAVRSWLLLKDRGRAADPLPLQVDVYFHSVGDLDEGYALVHAVVFTVEGHRSSDAA